jgi:hypothetical protein
MKQLDIGVVRDILMSMPDVQESTIHGSPSFKTRGKLLACPAIHKSVEPGSLVVKLPSAERDQLLAEEPHKYYLTNHYASGSVVLVRLSEIDRKALSSLLERAWLLLNRKGRDVKSTKPTLARQPASKNSPKNRSTGSRAKRASD